MEGPVRYFGHPEEKLTHSLVPSCHLSHCDSVLEVQSEYWHVERMHSSFRCFLDVDGALF